MNAIDKLFQELRDSRRKAFIPFLSAGDPSLEGTGLLLQEVVRQGADLVEIGFPYSDPIADGAVIQASYTRALDKGLQLDSIFDFVRKVTADKTFTTPLAAMVSYSIIHRRGPDHFLDAAREAGFSGVIVPDLPVEEAASMADMAKHRDFKFIQLITPTTPRERALQIARQATGFIYYVSVTGITGVRDKLPTELLDQLAGLRKQTDLPICVGFGISTPEHVRMLKPAVDGVIVGSAIVRKLESAATRPVTEVVAEIGALVRSLRQALD